MQKLFSPGPLCLSFFRKIRSHWSWISDDAAKTIFNLTMKENYRLYTLPYTLPLAQTSMVGVIKTFPGYIGMYNRCPNVLFLKVMSCYMTLSLTVERYISVVHPLLRWESLSLLSSNNSPSSRMTRRSPNSPKSFVYLAAPRSDSFSSPSLWARDRLSVKELSPASLSRSCSPCPPTSCCRPRLLHRSGQLKLSDYEVSWFSTWCLCSTLKSLPSNSCLLILECFRAAADLVSWPMTLCGASWCPMRGSLTFSSSGRTGPPPSSTSPPSHPPPPLLLLLILLMVRREDDAVITIYVLWLHLIFVTIIPVALLVWLNRIIYRKLSEAMIFLMVMMLAIYMYMRM